MALNPEQFNISDVDPEDIQLGPFEYRTADLAKLLGVSTTTVSGWVQQGKVRFDHTNGFGGGRPGYVFDLHQVAEDLAKADLSAWPKAEEYLQQVLDEIAVVEDDEALDTERRDAHDTEATHEAIFEREQVESESHPSDVLVIASLRERLDDVEGLLIRVVKAQHDGQHLSAQDNQEVLDIVLRHLEVR